MSEWPIYPTPDSVPVPVPQTSETPLPPAAAHFSELAERYAAMGMTADNPVIYSSGSETFRRTGEWVVKPFIKINGGFGSIVLDMQRAAATTQLISIELTIGMGEILIVIPEGWGADVSAVTTSFGTRKSKVSEVPNSNYPFLYVTGSLGMGTLTIRYPTPRDLKRMAREIRNEQRHQPPELR